MLMKLSQTAMSSSLEGKFFVYFLWYFKFEGAGIGGFPNNLLNFERVKIHKKGSDKRL